MKLSEHFTLEEMTASQTAKRLKIDNTPNAEAVKNLSALCRLILEPLRKAAKRPLIINSGYRSLKLNAEVGGASTSLHRKGRAADIHCEDYKDAANLAWAAKKLPFMDLAIIEQKGKATWLHVQSSLTPRHKIIEIIRP